jgi:hypothetical protein
MRRSISCRRTNVGLVAGSKGSPGAARSGSRAIPPASYRSAAAGWDHPASLTSRHADPGSGGSSGTRRLRALHRQRGPAGPRQACSDRRGGAAEIVPRRSPRCSAAGVAGRTRRSDRAITLSVGAAEYHRRRGAGGAPDSPPPSIETRCRRRDIDLRSGVIIASCGRGCGAGESRAGTDRALLEVGDGRSCCERWWRAAGGGPIARPAAARPPSEARVRPARPTGGARRSAAGVARSGAAAPAGGGAGLRSP